MSGIGTQLSSGGNSKEIRNDHSPDQKLSSETAQANDPDMLVLMRQFCSSLSEMAKLATSSSSAASEENTGEQSEPTTQGRVIIRERVITVEQIGAFKDLGLGRGVDATNPTPWLNKSAFQVREVMFDNIIGTEEGNLYQGFVNEVESTQNLQTSLKASIPLNQQVNLGIDSELSRSYSSTQKSVGRKIITRTIAFRADSDDISEIDKSQGSTGPTSDQESKVVGKGENPAENGNDQEGVEESSLKKMHPENSEKKGQESQKKGQANPQGKLETFEDHLTAWIQQRMKDDQVIKEIELGEVKKSDDKTKAEVPNGKSSETPKLKSLDECTIKDLSELCYKFVKTFSITHYVHSLELGASHYRVMSEEEYTTKIRSKGSLGAAQMADIAIGVEGSKTSKKLQRQTTKVGRMNLHYSEDPRDHDEPKPIPGQDGGAKISPEEEIRRGSIEEAVVGVKVQPISTLVVKSVKLQKALQDALQHFIQYRQKIKYGPFYICCNRESIFLSVSDSRQIEATQNIKYASKFYIVRCDEGEDRFFIVHEAPTSLPDKSVARFEKMPPVPMYLKASMNWRRRSTPTKPLMMEMNVNSRLSIHSRRDKDSHPAKLTEWVSQKEVFFIKCDNQAKFYPRRSYLCVYQPKGEAAYVTGCKPNIRSDDSKRSMLFRLVKLKEDEVSACTYTTSVASFFIKFQAKSGSDLFFEVSSDCKEVRITEEKEKASMFQLKVEKCNYFRIIYKSKGDQLYYLHAPAKRLARGQYLLGLSPREDASAQSYNIMAFYYVNDSPSRSRRLHQRELSDIIENSKDEVHITCQSSVDSSSRDVRDIYVKPKGNSFRVKAKHDKINKVHNAEAKQRTEEEHNAAAAANRLEEEHTAAETKNSTHFTGFVLQHVTDADCKATASTKTQHSPTGRAASETPSAEASKKSPNSTVETNKSSTSASSENPSTATELSNDDSSEPPSTERSKQLPGSPNKDVSYEPRSTENSNQIPRSPDKDSEIPSANNESSINVNSEPHSLEHSKQIQSSPGKHGESQASSTKDSPSSKPPSTKEENGVDTKVTSTGTSSELPSTKQTKPNHSPVGTVSNLNSSQLSNGTKPADNESKQHAVPPPLPAVDPGPVPRKGDWSTCGIM